MNAELMELAMEDGCDTAKELATWYQGYLRGEIAMIKSLRDELPEIDVDDDWVDDSKANDDADEYNAIHAFENQVF